MERYYHSQQDRGSITQPFDLEANIPLRYRRTHTFLKLVI